MKLYVTYGLYDEFVDWPMTIILYAFAALVALFFIGAYYAFTVEYPAREANRIKCEAAGGIVLERTYSQGKTTSRHYTCVKKDAVIDIPIE